jgi:phage shock protein C
VFPEFLLYDAVDDGGFGIVNNYRSSDDKENNMEKKLHRSRADRKFVGVCGGLGKYFDIDPTIVRLVFVALLFCGGLGFWMYLVMAIVVPQEPIAEQR